MREIKVKVWDKSYKCFLPEDIYAILNPTDFKAFGIMIKDWKDYKEGEYFYEGAQEMIQFTGLKDKNGKEIYEGDIVQTVADDGARLSKFTVYWDKGSCRFKKNREDNNCFDMDMISEGLKEVIGNIYESPNLLKP